MIHRRNNRRKTSKRPHVFAAGMRSNVDWKTRWRGLFAGRDPVTNRGKVSLP